MNNSYSNNNKNFESDTSHDNNANAVAMRREPTRKDNCTGFPTGDGAGLGAVLGGAGDEAREGSGLGAGLGAGLGGVLCGPGAGDGADLGAGATGDGPGLGAGDGGGVLFGLGGGLAGDGAAGLGAGAGDGNGSGYEAGLGAGDGTGLGAGLDTGVLGAGDGVGLGASDDDEARPGTGDVAGHNKRKATNEEANSDDEDADEDYVDLPAKQNRKSSNTTPIMFTNGLGLSADNLSQLKSVIETAKSKKAFSQTFEPDPSLFCLVYRWAHKPPYNFAADVLNSNSVVAREVGLSSPFDLCNLRGWILTRRSASANEFHIQYKRFEECLLQAKFPNGHKALNLNGMIQKVYERLDTCVLPSVLPKSLASQRKSIKSNKNISSAKKRKNVKASAEFELVQAHDPGSFKQRLTLNTKCLQIALFLMDFIFAPPILLAKDARTNLYFSMFSACYTSRRFVELCHGLLVLFDSPTPNKDKVSALSALVIQGEESNINLLDYVLGQVSFGHAETSALSDRINRDIVSKFPTGSIKNYANRKKDDQLAIMRYVVLSMFVQYKGNEIETSKHASPSKPKSAIRQALTDPMVVSPPTQTFAPVSARQPTIVVCTTLLDEVTTTAPTNLNGQTFVKPVMGDQVATTPFESWYSNFDDRFDSKKCRIATPNEVAPLAPRVYVEGDLFETNLYCAPLEFYLLRDLKNRNHGFKCDDLGLQPSVAKRCASLDIPMAVSSSTTIALGFL